MADEDKTEAKTTAVEFGAFEVAAVNDGGAEVRLSDKKGVSNLVLHSNSAAKGLLKGQKGVLVFNVEETPTEETVLVEVPADETAGLTSKARVVDRGATKKAATK